MKYLIVFFLIFNISFSQEWSKTELTKFASIEFPNSPERTDSDEVIYYSTSDDIGVYIAIIKDFKADPITANGLSEFYQGVMTGTLEAVNGEMLEKKTFEINNTKGWEMLYSANLNPESPDLRYKRFLYINNYLISYEVWTFKENEQLVSASMKKFFNSFSATVKEDNEPQVEMNSDLEKGVIVGKIFGFLFMIGIIVGSTVLIRNLIRKKK